MARGRKRAIKFRLKKGSITSTVSILFLLAAALVFVLIFSGDGSPLAVGLTSLFGWGSFFVPIILGFFGLVLWRRLNLPFIELRVFVGLVVFWFSFLLLGSYLGEGRGGALADSVFVVITSLMPVVGAAVISLAGILIALVIMLNASIEKLLVMLGWLINIFTSLLKLLSRGVVQISRALKEVASNITASLRNRSTSHFPLVLEEKPFKVNGGGVSGTNLEILPSPAEPVGSVRSDSKAKSNTEKLVSTTQILKEETVTNLPFSDKVWEYPPLSLLSDAPTIDADRGDIRERAATIERTLDSFGIRAKVVEVNKGPAVTQYALESPTGTKLTKIVSLQNDLALSLASPNGQVRIEAPIPGRPLVGVEVPNFSPSLVTLKSILTSEVMRGAKSKLTVAVGLDVAGRPVIADLGRMPHVLVAGATGSGKSVLINSFISTILFRASPSEVKLILVDPKRVEFASYSGIPHLHTPVIVEPDKALQALRWAVSEMERRYKLFENARVRNIAGYNEMSGFQALPYLVIIVDEFADLMHVAPVEIEKSVCRVAQMARAVGIHLILATQRPSVDVLTGLIKANIPTRIAFNVTSQVDSRVVLDQPGAEKLLGRGDMLYVPPEASKPQRIQGVYVSDGEINNLVQFLRDSKLEPEYETEIERPVVSSNFIGGSSGSGGRDELFEEAKNLIQQSDKASASLLQRRLSVGYARAARILDELEAAGVVGPQNASKPREVYQRGERVSAPIDEDEATP
jgi:S-DNA-T family DNA segregation ATPase FtsK/SpoIIIE